MNYPASMLSSLGLLPLVVACAAILGLFMGSFLNCWAWRIVHGESIMHGRSHCTSCGHALGPLDLVPVLSWVFTRGRCRYCGERIPARYPITELVCGVVYASIVCVYGLTWETLELLGFASCLFVLTLTDLDSFIIPNGCILAAIGFRLAYIGVTWATGGDGLGLLRDSVIGGLAVGVPLLVLVLVMDRVLGKASMGGGDLKLLAVAGMYFGFVQCLLLLVVACVLGIVVAFVQMARAGKQRPVDADAGANAEVDPAVSASTEAATSTSTEAATSAPSSSLSVTIPWGPSIAVACWFTMLAGGPIVSWYLSLF